MAYRGRPRFVEGLRWLRSDGKPNFSNRVYRVESDLERLATRPPQTTSSTTPLLKAIEKMYEKNIRSLVVVEGSGSYEGMLLAEHVVSFLGGGEKYDIVVNNFDNDLYKALNAPISIIYEKEYPRIDTRLKLTQVIQTMIEHGLTILPVVDKDNSVYGVISEHDIVSLLSEKNTGVSSKEVMSSNIVAVESEASLREAMSVMIRTGLRAVFVENEAGQIVGTLSLKSILSLIGSHRVFSHIRRGYVEDFTSIRVKEATRYGTLKANEDADVGDVASEMVDRGLSIALVVGEDETPVGMITEHDVFYALALPLE